MCCRSTHWNVSGLFVAIALSGCAWLPGGADPLESTYNLPAEIDSSDGFLAKPTKELVSTAKAAVGLGPNEEAARQQLQMATARYRAASNMDAKDREREFRMAAKEFAKSATRWPGSSVEEEALFFQAESYFFANRYPKSEEIFAQLMKKYPSTRYVDQTSTRRLQIAKYWLEHFEQDKDLPITPNLTSRTRPVFDKFGHAIRVLENIRLDDPTGELADDATMLAAKACFQSEKYYRADEFLTDLRRSFPGSEHQFNAHLLGLQCKVKLYQGPGYDSGPLDSAEELVKQMRRQFPNEARDHHEYLTGAYKDIRMNRAIREMNLARYRDRRQEYRAARAQYARVAREFSDTSLAAEASDRLAQLDGKPDLPGQRMEWLAKAFPSDADVQPLIANNPGVATRK